MTKLEKIIEIVKKDIHNSFISDSDGYYYLFEVIGRFEEDRDAKFEIYENVVKFLQENYKYVSVVDKHGNAIVYYYDTHFEFSTVKELENFFKFEF